MLGKSRYERAWNYLLNLYKLGSLLSNEISIFERLNTFNIMILLGLLVFSQISLVIKLILLWKDWLRMFLILLEKILFKRRAKVMLGKLYGKGNMMFTNICMDSSLVFASRIPLWRKRLRIKNSSTIYIMSEKILISSILIYLVLQRRICWFLWMAIPLEWWSQYCIVFIEKIKLSRTSQSLSIYKQQHFS